MRRIALVAALILLGGSAAVLVSTSPAPRREAFYLNRPVRLWALDLNNPSAVVRDKATETIRLFGPDALPDLTNLLCKPDSMLARPLKSIGRRVPEKVSRRLFQFVNPYEAGSERAAGILALRTMGTNAQSALPALRRALGFDQTVAWHAALALAELGPSGLSALTDALSKASPAQSGFICYALSTRGSSASNAVPALSALLRQGPLELAEKAANTLSSIRGPAVPSLIQALSLPDLQVRLLTIQALSNMGPLGRDAVPRLLNVAKSNQPAERLAAVEALSQIRPRSMDVIAAFTASLHDPEVAIRLKAINGLSCSPSASTKALPALVTLLKDESAAVRSQAAGLIGDIGSVNDNVIPALRQALQDTSEIVRAQAQGALAKLHHRSS